MDDDLKLKEYIYKLISDDCVLGEEKIAIEKLMVDELISDKRLEKLINIFYQNINGENLTNIKKYILQTRLFFDPLSIIYFVSDSYRVGEISKDEAVMFLSSIPHVERKDLPNRCINLLDLADLIDTDLKEGFSGIGEEDDVFFDDLININKNE